MQRQLQLLACFALTAIGCRGCQDRTEEPPPAAEAERSVQSERARVLSRMSSRKLDRAKVYPKDAQGVVQCGRDMDCFILQAERCTVSSLDHVQTVSGYGISQYVRARYRITGSEVGRCKVEREVLAIDAKLDKVMIEGLRKRGKTDEEIATLRSDALDSLRGRNPPRLECFLSADQTLEASLNLAEGRYNPLHWRTACRELQGPSPQVGELTEAEKPAPSEPAAPAKAAKADVPVPKQP